jgi:hypothetical protein
MAQMLLADHSLAEVQLRYAERHRPSVPRIWRLCCFCTKEIEDPPHAMFGCNDSSELIALWSAFLATVFKVCPSLHLIALSATPESFFCKALSQRNITNILAKLAYDTLQVFENKDIHIVDSALHTNTTQDAVAAVPILTPNNLML